MGTVIRTANATDASALAAIYAPYVENTAVSFEYTAPTTAEFAVRIENTLKKYPYLVLENDGVICGYAYAGEFGERMAFCHSAEVSIYLHTDARGKGYGKLLYDKLEELLALQGITNVFAAIAHTGRENDEHLTDKSFLFHTKMGHRLVGKLEKCGYKFGKWYDLIWTEKSIGECSGAPKEFVPFPKLNK